MDINITLDASSFEKYMNDKPAAFRRALQTTIREGAYIIERLAKINAPVDTGRLRASIYTEIMQLKATIRPNVNYAIFVHEGTRFITSRPFMTDAAHTADAEIQNILNREVASVLK